MAGNVWTYSSMASNGKPFFMRTAASRAMTRPGSDPSAVTMNVDGYGFVLDMMGKEASLPIAGSCSWRLRSDSGGLFMLAGPEGAFEPPLQLAKPTLTNGDKWQWSGKVRGLSESQGSATVTVSGPEEIETGSLLSKKKYAAMRVYIVLMTGTGAEQKKREEVYWFVSGVGPVQMFVGSKHYTLSSHALK